MDLPAQRLEALLNASPDPVFVYDDAGRCVFVNPAGAALVGRERAAILGRTSGELGLAQDATATRRGEEYVLRVGAAPRAGDPGGALAADDRYASLAQASEAARARAEASEAETNALYALTDAVNRAERLEDLYDPALDAVRRALGVGRAAILLADDAGVMRFAAWRGLSDGYRRAVEGHSPWPRDATRPSAVFVPDVLEDAAFGPLRATIAAEGIRALAFVPLVHRHRLLGKFMLYADAPRAFTPREAQLAAVIATHLALGVARQQARAEASRLYADAERARAAAQAATHTLAAVIDASPLAVMLLDEDGTVRLWNRAAEAIFGWRADEVVGRFLPTVPGEARGAFLASVARVTAGETITGAETVRAKKSGELIDAAIWGAPVRASDGRVQCLSIVADVTDRKRDEAALRAGTTRVRALAEASQVFAAAGLDLRATLAAVARFVSELLGDACAITLLGEGGTTLDPVATYHHDPAARADLERSFASPFALDEGLPGRAFQAGAPVVLGRDELARAAEGDPAARAYLARRAPHSVAVVPLRVRGRSVGTLSLSREGDRPPLAAADVALLEELADRAAVLIENARLYGAARALEDRAEILAEASEAIASSLDYEDTLARVARLPVPRFADAAGLYLLEPDGAIRQAAVCHVDPAMEASLWELERLIPIRLDQDRVLPRAMRTGRSQLVASVPEALLASWSPNDRAAAIVAALGVRSYMAVPLVLRGRVLGAIAIATTRASGRRFGEADLALAEEIARRAGVAIENAELYREAQRASRLKDEFLATVSHELRTPLNAVLGWTQMLRGRAGDPAALAKGLDTIERNARAQAKLIEDLLDVSRIINGKLVLSTRRTDVGPVVHAAVDAVRPAAVAKRLDLAVDVDPGAGALVADPDRLQQVVWNLASNAVKFTPEGGRVAVRAERADGRVRIVVQDSGPGIAPEFIPHLFERFRQADQSTTRRHGGLGLGLAIVRHLVELHGGRVEARSEGEGKGATFVVTLPIAVAHRDAADARDAGDEARPRVPPAAPTLDGLRVLVAEDDPDAAELIALFLAERGAEVRTVPSATAALEAFPAFHPDVLVSDIAMPGDLDGYDLLRAVRTRPRTDGGDVPAVALTAYARAEDRARALAAGFHAHLSKPVEPDELVALVARLAARA